MITCVHTHQQSDGLYVYKYMDACTYVSTPTYTYQCAYIHTHEQVIDCALIEANDSFNGVGIVKLMGREAVCVLCPVAVSSVHLSYALGICRCALCFQLV